MSISHLSTDVTNRWYAVEISSNVQSPRRPSDRIRPTGLRVLGHPLVLWRDSAGTLRAVEDRCPHRSVPLSIGQNVGGTLECLYHGWQVDGGSGRVCHVPSATSIPGNARCRIYPVHEMDNVVWVWMGEPPPPPSRWDEGGERRDTTTADFVHPANGRSVYDTENLPPSDCMATVEDSTPLANNPAFVQQVFCFDLPVDHSLMVENLLDPAHVPFAHEGTIGRRSEARPLEMTMTNFEVTAPNGGKLRGFKGETEPNMVPFDAPNFLAFAEPCHNILCTPLTAKWKLWQFVSCTPTRSGHMRMVYRAYRNWMKFLDWTPLTRKLFDSFSHRIIFQDYTLLAGQQERLWEGAPAWNAATQVDCLPVLYRKFWAKTFGAGWDGTTQRSKRQRTGKVGDKSRVVVDGETRGVWFSGFDERGLIDIEDLDRVGTHYDCDGCASPAIPYHPLNPFPNRNVVGSVGGRAPNVVDASMRWLKAFALVGIGIVGGVGLAVFYRQKE